MSLKNDLIALNRKFSSSEFTTLPYNLTDVRNVLIANTKFNRKYTFDGILPVDTIMELRGEGLDVMVENDKTIVSWEIR